MIKFPFYNRTQFFGFSLLLSLVFSCTPQKTQTGLVGEKAMVVSAHPLASEVGKEILLQGGNAVDAAIAVHMALAVVYPQAGNLGGGGFMVIREKNGAVHSLDYREKAPLGASRDMYLDEEGNPQPEISQNGHLASGVPGSVDGMVKAHEKFGTLPWSKLINPAILLAEEGYKLTNVEANFLSETSIKLKKYSSIDPIHFTAKEFKKGDVLVQKELAQTLKLIRDNGREGFYSGEVADYLVAEMKRGGGLINHEDLENYESKWREPLTGNYKDYKVITMGPPSGGGIILLQMLGILENHSISKDKYSNYLHLKTEMERRIYADRAEYMADADFYPVPVEQLVADKYLKERFQNFNPEKATPSNEIKAGDIPLESEETTHFSIVDEEGNAVSSTTTLNGNMGSKVLVAGAGFILNNEMDDFSIKPGFPNMFGVLGGEANKVEPKKRMLSSMSPTILEKNGSLYMVVGTPGGSTIPTSVFQVIVNVIEFDMGMHQSVNEKRFHSQWKPDWISYEKGYSDKAILKELGAKGHELNERNAIGKVDAILKREDGTLEAGADSRGMDTAAGY
ncbi:gamma-glutamyltransferase [Cyclobacterium qasimii]|uniref:Glutathione hydrolase proenzyme n=2 Tax=Cyclobacterium qasimii TaxID=1350429 RepID=S7X6I7_9BACT|nr:gamma-glutamyltransferase [Cyclobacterium qasimii]EPR71658.1 Gamma-glutamyltranspeptidase [Cyclobacterium qasimii M12-11B]GEO22430.1 gamma-glutamyltransferase [Cyclobacterium qasimii]